MDVVDLPFAQRPASDPSHDRAASSHEEVRGFVDLVRGAFLHRRKTLRSALGYVVDKAALARVSKSFDMSRRPEAIDVKEWHRIYEAVKAGSDSAS
jgi:16S rRNA A1518/A1519 N6-dimethyltransferase RsmA/KsgA/DIM1 with predicted DNA glycosylase/AP lyase activity